MSIEHSPARRLLSPKHVGILMNWSRTTLWRRVRAGEFCAPVKTGANTSGFWEDEVAQEQAKLPRVSYAPAAPADTSHDTDPAQQDLAGIGHNGAPEATVALAEDATAPPVALTEATA